jgi:DNA primase
MARQEISRDDRAVVVEGYTDVIAMHQGGMGSSVATCGTALGEDHLEILGRLGGKIVLAFDADRAGGDAALRGEEVSRRSGRRLNLRVARLPDGKDPADLMQDGRMADLIEAIGNARSVLEYRIERRFESVDLTDPESVAPAINELAPLVAKVEDQTAKGLYERMLVDKSGMDLQQIQRAARRAVKPTSRVDDGRTPRRMRRRPIRRGSPTERELLRAVLLNHPQLQELELDETLFAEGLYRQAFERVEPLWRAASPGQVTSLPGEGNEQGQEDASQASGRDEISTELLAIALDQSEIGDPRPMVIVCRDAALAREADAVRARMRSLPRNDPMRDELLGKVGELERRRQELAEALS